MASLLEGETKSRISAWAVELQGASVPWTTLDPSELKAEAGSILTVQPDRSVLASGSEPAEETYTIKATTDLVGITAARLELLPDESLPATDLAATRTATFI